VNHSALRRGGVHAAKQHQVAAGSSSSRQSFSVASAWFMV
jgi:hypothetical protein